jgi:hypothetical protein
MITFLELPFVKDIFYLVGSLLGIITFILTVRKRDRSKLTFRTEMGNESCPMLFCIKGDIFNVRLRKDQKSQISYRLPSTFKFSSIRTNDYSKHEFDDSSFFPIIKEGEALLLINEIENDHANIKVKIEFEDQFGNLYYQLFTLLNSDIGNPKRFTKNRSQSLYRMSKRYKRFLWVWH